MIMLDIPLVYSIAVVITCTWHNHFCYFRHQCMLVAGLSKQTMALQDDELHFAHIKIQSCRHSNIYIMAPSGIYLT